MPRVFISYRRTDSDPIVGRIYDHLTRAYGRDNVFKDVDSIHPGADFRKSLMDAVEQCDVLIAVIGPGWIDATDEQGNHRLDSPTDFVRLEIESAFARKIRVIPVLVGGARMPGPNRLKGILVDLSYINASQVRTDPDFTGDIERLIQAIDPSSRPGPRKRRPLVWIAACVLGVAVVWAVLANLAQRPRPEQNYVDPRPVAPAREDMGGAITVTVNGNPLAVRPGGSTRLTITAQARDGSALRDAQVVVAAGGGSFDSTGAARSIGTTDARGNFSTTWHTYDASAHSGSMSYVINATVSKQGFDKGEGSIQIFVNK